MTDFEFEMSEEQVQECMSKALRKGEMIRWGRKRFYIAKIYRQFVLYLGDKFIVHEIHFNNNFDDIHLVSQRFIETA